MESTNKLIKLDSEKGILKGGFAVLTLNQLDKLKGGNATGDVNMGNCGNCGCTNLGC